MPVFTAAQLMGATSKAIRGQGQTNVAYTRMLLSEISQTHKGSYGPALPLRLLESSRSDTEDWARGG